MGSDHDFLAENAGFFTVVRDLLRKYAGFLAISRGGRAKSAAERPFLRAKSLLRSIPDEPAAWPGDADHGFAP
jgi:hypothetical protein